VPIAHSLPTPSSDLAPRDFHARMTRAGRARAVLAQRRRRLRKRYAALAVALAVPAMAGATDWGNAPPHSAPAHLVADRSSAAGLTGAAYSAPEPGLGDDPASFADPAAGGAAARAFMTSGSWLDRARAEQCLTMAVYYEAATESDDGQRAVAQVVLNRVAHPSYPDTVCGVVFQGSERSTGCQFTFTCDGSLARKPAPFWWDRARRVAQQALSGAVYAPVGLATNYHTLQVHPAWDSYLIPVTTIGAHRFFRLPGAAGLASAFRAAYSGGEPLAAPHARVFTPSGDSDPDPVALARAHEASARQPAATATRFAPASAPPAYSEAIQARGGDALFRGDNLPAGGDLSPQLQRSGQWLDRQ
jgi:spore germination cell wall hydrolase CwlJ-like protein